MTGMFDLSEVRALEQDLGRISGQVVKPLTETLTKSANAVRDAMRADAAGHAHFPHFPNAITADVKTRVGQLEAEIGPDKSRTQGALGNILYFGTSKNGPVLNINAGLDAEAPKFEQAVAEAAGRLFDE
jgi:hypothetical protein